jgi:hypothetical protein
MSKKEEIKTDVEKAAQLISDTGAFELSKEIEIKDANDVSKKVKVLKVLKESEVSGAVLFEHVDADSKNQIGVLGYLTGLSTAELHQLNARDYSKLMAYMGNLMS